HTAGRIVMANGRGGEPPYIEDAEAAEEIFWRKEGPKLKAERDRLLEELARKSAGGDQYDAPWGMPDLSLLNAEAIVPPDFPDILRAGWGDWARAAAEGAGGPVDYVGLPLLSSLGTLIGNQRWGSPGRDGRSRQS